MKLKKILSAVFAASMLIFSSCEDGLDIPKHGNMGGQEDFYKTDAEVEQAVASLFTSWGGNYYNWFFLKNLISDDVWTGGGSRGDNSDMERLNEYNFDTDHGMISGLYQGLYGIIYKANLIIEKVEPDSPVKKQAIAEAYFFRAWAHFELVTLWGTAPVVDHLLEPDEYHQPNSTPEQLWAQVESDLHTAIDSNALPSKSGVNDPAAGIRVAKEVAQAMLGKALLFQGKYAEAATELDKVINSGKYELYTGEYDLLHHVATNGCCEAMLEVQKRFDPEQTWSQFTMTYLMMGWRTGLLNMGSMDMIAMGTYGFINPTAALYDAFVAREGKDGYRLKGTIRTYDELNAEYGLSVNAGERLVGHEGLFNWKNRALKEDCIIDASYFQGMQYINLRVMRYAEVLLLAAEAHVMSGGSKATDYVNAIRTRAHLAPLSSVTMDDVKAEKRLELCMECTRFQDLVRWGDAEKYLGERGKNVPAFSSTGLEASAFTNATYGFKDKHKLLPIPRKEMELNLNMEQNPGW